MKTTTNKPTNKNKLVDKNNGWVETTYKEFLSLVKKNMTVQEGFDAVGVKMESRMKKWGSTPKSFLFLFKEFFKQHLSKEIDKAVKEERVRFVEMIGEVEAIPTHINNHVIDRNNPFLNWCKGKNKLRQELITKLTKDN